MAPIIHLKGRGATQATLPLDLAASREYFADVAAFLTKIEDVDRLKPLGREGAYLVMHHPVGGLGYTVVLVSCLQVDWHGGGMRLTPLDFELEKIRSEHPVVKGFIEAELALREGTGGTEAGLDFTITVELPIPSALRLVPQGLVQSTGDGILAFKVARVVESLFQKVMADMPMPLAAGPL